MRQHQKEKIKNKLVENKKILDKESKTTEHLNTLFSNIVGNLNIVEYSNYNPLVIQL